MKELPTFKANYKFAACRHVAVMTIALVSAIPFAMSATVPSDASKDNPFTNTIGMKFVPVPIPGQKPVLFCIWKARVRDFTAFVEATGYDATQGMYSFNDSGKPGQWGKDWKDPGFTQTPEHPVCGVSFLDAEAFCSWLSKKEGVHYRLPTDHEWSCAVGIGDKEQATANPLENNGAIKDVYPWGTQWPPPNEAGNYAGQECREMFQAFPVPIQPIEGHKDNYIFTSPVGSFAANSFGLYDLGGNLWEWCDNEGAGAIRNPGLTTPGGFAVTEMTLASGNKVLRGASFGDTDDARNKLLSSYRRVGSSDMRFYRHGFRVVIDTGSTAAPTTK